MIRTTPVPATNHRRRGTAMTETVLVLPLIFLVLGLLFFFGWSFAHLQHATVADRYEAWRRVYHAPRPGASTSGSATDQLNQTFFAGRASISRLGIDTDFPQAPANLIRDEAAIHSPQAGRLADHALEQLPSGLRITLRARPTTPLPLADRLSGTVIHRHLRLDNEWKYANGIAGNQSSPAPPYVRIEISVRDLFLEQLDDQLDPLAEQDNPLARSMQRTWQAVPPYRGPDVQ